MCSDKPTMIQSLDNQQEKDELISVLWRLKNAAGWVNFGHLLHDRKLRSAFIRQAANSPFSEIRHAARRARELNNQGWLG